MDCGGRSFTISIETETAVMSECNRRPSASLTPWLVAGVLLVAVAAMLIAFVPLTACPVCAEPGSPLYWRGNLSFKCRFCFGKERVSGLKKWSHRIAEAR